MFPPLLFLPTLFTPTLFPPTLFPPTLFTPTLFPPTLFTPTLFTPKICSARTKLLGYSVHQFLKKLHVLNDLMNSCIFRDAFKQFDKDGNGYIDKDELISLMESLGIRTLYLINLTAPYLLDIFSISLGFVHNDGGYNSIHYT